VPPKETRSSSARLLKKILPAGSAKGGDFF
jgi:hypothetical protein